LKTTLVKRSNHLVPPGLPGALLLAALIASADEPAAKVAPTNLSPAALEIPGGIQQGIWKKALDAGDLEVASALDYNSIHTGLLNATPEAASTFLSRLEKHGDEFTVHWLDKLTANDAPAVSRELIELTRNRIRERLARHPLKSEQMVRPRFFRAAVADVTCNALERPLKEFVWAWAQAHCGTVECQRELRHLLKDQVLPSEELGPETIRQRVQSYARTFLGARDPLEAPL
jgi:hypothetical protein